MHFTGILIRFFCHKHCSFLGDQLLLDIRGNSLFVGGNIACQPLPDSAAASSSSTFKHRRSTPPPQTTLPSPLIHQKHYSQKGPLIVEKVTMEITYNIVKITARKTYKNVCLGVEITNPTELLKLFLERL